MLKQYRNWHPTPEIKLGVSRRNEFAGYVFSIKRRDKIMDEQFIEELNDALSVLWKAGRATESFVDLKQLMRSTEMAMSLGFNSVSDDGIDTDSAYFNF